jgi:hypothetical protein
MPVLKNPHLDELYMDHLPQLSRNLHPVNCVKDGISKTNYTVLCFQKLMHYGP